MTAQIADGVTYFNDDRFNLGVFGAGFRTLAEAATMWRQPILNPVLEVNDERWLGRAIASGGGMDCVTPSA